jgi:hypothetical protein
VKRGQRAEGREKRHIERAEEGCDLPYLLFSSLVIYVIEKS